MAYTVRAGSIEMHTLMEWSRVSGVCVCVWMGNHTPYDDIERAMCTKRLRSQRMTRKQCSCATNESTNADASHANTEFILYIHFHGGSQVPCERVCVGGWTEMKWNNSNVWNTAKGKKELLFSISIWQIFKVRIHVARLTVCTLHVRKCPPSYAKQSITLLKKIIHNLELSSPPSQLLLGDAICRFSFLVSSSLLPANQLDQREFKSLFLDYSAIRYTEMDTYYKWADDNDMNIQFIRMVFV